MKTSDSGIALLKQFEGCELKAYRDSVGVLTIGYGHTGPDVHVGSIWTQQAADNQLKTDLEHFEHGVLNYVKVPLTQNQFDALVCLTYNIGLGNFGHSTLLRNLNAGNYQLAAEQFPVWCHAGGKTLKGLVKRREAEKELFLT